METFKCTGEGLEEIPEVIAVEKGIAFPKAHADKMVMAQLAKELKAFKGDSFCRIPFCVTVEAEAFGAKIKLGDNKSGPRVESYISAGIEELAEIKAMDLNSKRIKEVLDCLDILRQEGEVAALNIEGPFTIISSLIEPTIFYKAIRQRPELIEKVMTVIEDSLVEYILEGLKRGAKVISYGDPVGGMDIVGPKIYKEYSGKMSYKILKRIEPHIGDAIIHLCGKTSTALEKFGYSRTVKLPGFGKTYGEALISILSSSVETRFIGHRCIKNSYMPLTNPVLWGVILSNTLED